LCVDITTRVSHLVPLNFFSLNKIVPFLGLNKCKAGGDGGYLEETHY
jgi:hypothetical protein